MCMSVVSKVRSLLVPLLALVCYELRCESSMTAAFAVLLRHEAALPVRPRLGRYAQGLYSLLPYHFARFLRLNTQHTVILAGHPDVL